MESDGGMVFAPPKDRRPDALGDLKVLPDELLCAIFESLFVSLAALPVLVSRYMKFKSGVDFADHMPYFQRVC